MRTKQLSLVLVLIVALIAIALGASLFVQAGREVTRFEENRPLPGAVLYDQEGTVIKRLGTGSVFISLEKVPQDLQNAVKSTQNKSFFKEQGLAQGTRTITERLARQILEPKGLWGKMKASILPTVLQRRYSERELLEMYLNQAYFGEGAYGVEAASQTYFAKPVQEIDLAQSALLAGLAQEPEQASPYSHPQRAKKLRDAVLVQMQKDDQITKAKQEEAAKASLALERREPGQAHYFSDYLSKMLVDKLGEERVFQGGLKIETTLNLTLQKMAENIFAKHEVQGALVAIDPEHGQILAMVGGLNYLENKTNLATTKHKDVGTTLRPLIYATGLTEGWAMNHLVEDVQRKFDDYEVKNAGDRYWGAITMKHALALDLNNAAVWTLNKLGLEKFNTFAQSVDIKLNSADLKLRLAMGEVEKGLSLLELTAAYMPGAKKGIYIPVSSFKQVKDSQDKEVLKIQNNTPKRVFTEQQAYLFTDLLMASASYGSIRKLEVDFPAALTASLSQDTKSQWAIGYTPSLLAGVYVVTPEMKDEEASKATASLIAGQIWREFMEQATGEKLVEAEFAVPADIETDVLIDVFTGLLGSERCPQVELDAFIKGTAPTQSAPCAIPPPPPVVSPSVPQAPQPPQTPAKPVVPEAKPEPQPPQTPPAEPILPVEPTEPTEAEPPPPPVQPSEPPSAELPQQPLPEVPPNNQEPEPIEPRR